MLRSPGVQSLMPRLIDDIRLLEKQEPYASDPGARICLERMIERISEKQPAKQVRIDEADTSNIPFPP